MLLVLTCANILTTDQRQDHLLVGYDQNAKSRLGGHVQSDDKIIVDQMDLTHLFSDQRLQVCRSLGRFE